jgi:hypothetical protein
MALPRARRLYVEVIDDVCLGDEIDEPNWHQSFMVPAELHTEYSQCDYYHRVILVGEIGLLGEEESEQVYLSLTHPGEMYLTAPGSKAPNIHLTDADCGDFIVNSLRRVLKSNNFEP